MEVIWVGGEGKYFLRGDWTGGISLIRFNKLAFGENALWRMAPARTMAALSDDTRHAGKKRLEAVADE
jgi:hypothetical protein